MGGRNVVDESVGLVKVRAEVIKGLEELSDGPEVSSRKHI